MPKTDSVINQFKAVRLGATITGCTVFDNCPQLALCIGAQKGRYWFKDKEHTTTYSFRREARFISMGEAIPTLTEMVVAVPQRCIQAERARAPCRHSRMARPCPINGALNFS